MKHSPLLPCPAGRRTADDLFRELSELIALGVLSEEDARQLQAEAA